MRPPPATPTLVSAAGFFATVVDVGSFAGTARKLGHTLR